MKITKKEIINYKKNGIIKMHSIVTKKDCDNIIKFIKKVFIQYLKIKNIKFKNS